MSTCLVVHVISNSEVAIDVWFFPVTSHTTSQNLNGACRVTCSLFLCKFLRVKCQKLAKKLCQKYTLVSTVFKVSRAVYKGPVWESTITLNKIAYLHAHYLLLTPPTPY